MSDSEKTEQTYSLLQDEVSNDNGSLQSSVTRLQTTRPAITIKSAVCLALVLLVFTTIAGTAGFFVGKAVIKEQYKSNIEREFCKFKVA
jgi:hypothetical protein